MLTQKYFTTISRILAGLIFALGGYWLALSWYIVSKMNVEIAVLPLSMLLSFHFIGALAGFRSGIGGMLGMIVFTVLSLIAPFYLNIPFRTSYWPYFLLIGLQLTALILYSIQKERFAPKLEADSNQR